MKVLVYGAGALGCLLAHQLAGASGLEVALLARGTWADALKRDGLTIRHYGRHRTTMDRIRIVRELSSADDYGFMFVVLQSQQLPDVPPILANSSCRRIVFVGNNANAVDTESRLFDLTRKASASAKEVAFAFQATGGNRNFDRTCVTAVYARLGITLGGAEKPLSPDFTSTLEETLSAAGFTMTRENRMDAWLKCHLAFVLPMAFVSYACGCNPRRAKLRNFTRALDACNETFHMLTVHGIPILPEGDEDDARPSWRRTLMETAFWLLAKTRLGDLAVTDHCRHAVSEMHALTTEFERFLTPDIARDMPTWATLRTRMPHGMSCRRPSA